VLKESELQGIARVCNDYGVLAIEDLAYFGMDLRQNYYVPGEPPYQPTILRYTNRSISIISSSKIFSYAGQRCALMIMHPGLYSMRVPHIKEWTGTDHLGHALVHGIVYPMIACVPQSPQYALLALLKAANRGEPKIFDVGRRYAERAKKLKQLYLENGFQLVYDNDLGEPLADGFYFTISYPTYDSGAKLIEELIHYGVSAVTLETSGSIRTEGLRACVSLIGEAETETLAYRLRRFHEDHPIP
jgi:aspartate/methionine/tyrosine aminotransferase